MLARDLAPAARARGHEVIALPRAELDVTDHAQLTATIRDAAPDALVMGAAFTNVEEAEDQEALAERINADAAGAAARACHQAGALFVYPSTDYVFSGESPAPYTPSAPTGPLNAYGRTKLRGEQLAREVTEPLIVRTSWLYGAHGPNFVETMLRLGAEHERIEVVADQTGRPTWTMPLAEAMVLLIEGDARGVFHVTGEGPPVSWAGFAARIFELAGMSTEVVPVPSSARPSRAERPASSALDTLDAARRTGHFVPDWRESLADYLASRPG